MNKVLLPSLCELVAPGVAITALLLLPLGPILIPRFYLLFLFVYFTFFLYTQINHVFKFFITTKKIIHNIRTWNLHQKVSSPNTFSTSSGSASPLTARERMVADENNLNDVEASLKIYEDSHYIHTFIIPNYCEPEALLRDTIKRLANHRLANFLANEKKKLSETFLLNLVGYLETLGDAMLFYWPWKVPRLSMSRREII
jgi:hypothetical protein